MNLTYKGTELNKTEIARAYSIQKQNTSSKPKN